METVSKLKETVVHGVVAAVARKHKRPKRPPNLMREDVLHRVVIEHLASRARHGVAYWHTPNGGKRHLYEAAKLKKMGVLAGMPDLLLLRDGKLYALELKTEAGRVSDCQHLALAMLSSAGAQIAVAYGLSEALAKLEAWDLII